ncbi:MAG: serine hydrolase domain-containing protein [Spirochaetota bacterium]
MSNPERRETAVELPRAPSPESAGIPSRAVLRFLDRIERERVPMHGLLLVRRGRIAAEGYWAPFTAESRHRMYSVSKSFVSLAVGLMVDEGRFSLDDRVADLLPDKVPDDAHPWAADPWAAHPWARAATVRHLLTMATQNSKTSYTPADADWARTFFAVEPSHPPGTLFNYDTAATVVLTTIVERLAGATFLDYLRPRLLDAIGFSPDAWCVETPEGTSWGGSGVICTLRDMAKVAHVCMHGGRWGGAELLPEWYVREATTKQIDNTIIHGKHGYGYQIWRLPENGFGFVGMGSQLAYCFPDRDFEFACTADTQGIGPTGEGVVDAMWDELYANLSDESLPEDPQAAAELEARLAGLRLLPRAGAATSPLAARISGRWYELEPNPMRIERLRVDLGVERGTLRYAKAGAEKRIDFGLGRQVDGTFPETHYYGRRIGVPAGREYRCLASAAWVEESKLDLLVYITDDYLGTLRASLSFTGDEVGVHMTKVAEWFLDEYEGFAGGRAGRT